MPLSCLHAQGVVTHTSTHCFTAFVRSHPARFWDREGFQQCQERSGCTIRCSRGFDKEHSKIDFVELWSQRRRIQPGPIKASGVPPFCSKASLSCHATEPTETEGTSETRRDARYVAGRPYAGATARALPRQGGTTAWPIARPASPRGCPSPPSPLARNR